MQICLELLALFAPLWRTSISSPEPAFLLVSTKNANSDQVRFLSMCRVLIFNLQQIRFEHKELGLISAVLSCVIEPNKGPNLARVHVHGVDQNKSGLSRLGEHNPHDKASQVDTLLVLTRMLGMQWTYCAHNKGPLDPSRCFRLGGNNIPSVSE